MATKTAVDRRPVTPATEMVRFKKWADKIITKAEQGDRIGAAIACRAFIAMLEMELHDGNRFSEFMQGSISKTGILLKSTGLDFTEELDNLRNVYARGVSK